LTVKIHKDESILQQIEDNYKELLNLRSLIPELKEAFKR